MRAHDLTAIPTSASASISITSRPSATRAAGVHPDPVRAAKIAIEAGADGITAHLREDRRHIRDDDIARLKAEIAKPLNLEMAATDEMVAHRDCRPGRMPPASCRNGARSAPPKAASMRPASATCSRRRSPELRGRGHPRLAVHRAEPRADRGGGVASARRSIEIHTGAWCDALADGHMRAADGRVARIRDGGEACAAASGSKSMPATGSTSRPPRRSRRCRRSSSSTSAIS